jgi:hypothetical protein
MFFQVCRIQLCNIASILHRVLIIVVLTLN